MSKNEWKFTSEAVTPGHPDKVCDVIVENIMSEILTEDPNSRIALEGILGKGFLTLAGELTTKSYIDFQSVARKTILEIGYNNASFGLDGNSVGVLSGVTEQSPEIAGGVFKSLEARTSQEVEDFDKQGAGDQGIVFGTAVNHNTSYQPVTHKLSELLAERLYYVRLNPEKFGLETTPLRPDAKTQVTVDFVDGKPVAIDTVLISTQHHPNYSLEEVQKFVTEHIIRPVIADYNENHATVGYKLADKENYIINPAGVWTVGGPASDAGLVNRKIVVDTTGGWGRHGGGGLNGKDFSKTDRSGVYAARHAAKNLVAAGFAEQVEIQIAYAIGQARPVSVYVNTFGTSKVSDELIQKAVDEVFDFRPLAIKAGLQPKPEAFKHTGMFGHLGRNPEGLFLWENLDLVEKLKALQ